MNYDDDLLARLDAIAGCCYDTDDTTAAETLSKAVDIIRQLSWGQDLRDEAAQLELSGWRDIATAPKDGMRVLLATPSGKIADGYWSLHYKVWSWPYVMVNPTHWMPAPISPAPRPT